MAKKVKLPKKVGGVKIPKELRKGGEKLIEQAQTDAGRAAIARGAATLAGIAATAVQAAAMKQHAASPPPAPAPAAPAANDAGSAKPEGEKVAEAISTVADAVLSRLFAGGKR